MKPVKSLRSSERSGTNVLCITMRCYLYWSVQCDFRRCIFEPSTWCILYKGPAIIIEGHP